MVRFNTIMRQTTEMSQRKKNSLHKLTNQQKT